MITGTTGVSGAGFAAGVTGRTEMNQSQFLELLVTQLKNQDPMSPLQPHEFAAQLAQFASVEQLTQLNQAVAAQDQSIQVLAMLGQTTFSASLIGKQVLADGNQVSIPTGRAASVTVDVGGSGGTATLRLLDASGREVASRDLGHVAGGRRTLQLPADLPPGTYTYEIRVSGAESAPAAVKHYVSGTVRQVSFDSGQIILDVGGVKVSMDALAEIGSEISSTTATAPAAARWAGGLFFTNQGGNIR
jgi:flagellar basal-body rod modification protein FlgD